MDHRSISPETLQSITPEQCTTDVLHAVLHATPFFAPLPHAAIPEIARYFRQRDYRAGEVIHLFRQQADRLEIVAAGSVTLTRPTETGRDVVLDVLTPGAFFGALDLLGSDAYSDTAIANTDCCILIASSATFRRILLAYPEAAVASLDYVAGRLRSAHDLIEQLSAYRVERRLAATLLKLADLMGEDHGDEVRIGMPLSRQDLADMIGATVETTSRVMSAFRDQGLIRSGRRWVSILDRSGVERLASDEFPTQN